MSINPSLSTILAQGTATGLRISSADGVALLDNCPSAITDLVALYPGKLNILILDASNRVIEGWAGSVGTVETTLSIYASNFSSTVDGWAFNWYDAYVSGTANQDGIDGEDNWMKVQRITTTGRLSLYRALNADHQYKLVKHSIDIFNPVGSSITAFRMSFGGGTFVDGNISVSAGSRATGSIYKTIPSPTLSRYLSEATENVEPNHYLYTKNAVINQVTAPSTSGLTLFSTKGGATQNCVSKDASFVYNAASYRYVVRGQRIVSNIGSWIK